MTDVADVFWTAQKTGAYPPNEPTMALSVDEGERMQLVMLDRWRATGETLGGWKVGLTSGRSRDGFGPGVRPFGFILRSRIFPNGATIERARIPKLGVETELAFRIGTRLAGPNVTPAQARGAVAAVAPAFEINELRIDPRADSGCRAADNLSQWGIAVGAEHHPVPDADFTALTVSFSRDGQVLETLAAAGHIDDHFSSLAALARELAKFGLAVEPGQQVITGSYTRQNIEQNGDYVGDFGLLGSVALRFI